MTTANIAAVILAAGESRRFGQPKQLLPWEGRPLVAHLADVAWAAGLTPTIVVLGAQAERIRPTLEHRPVQVLQNYRWAEGMSSSIHVGLSALPPSCQGALFIPVDQPLLTPQFLRSLVDTWQKHPGSIVIPTDAQHGQGGTPVLFDRAFFPELAQLSGDVGGRALFATHAAHIVRHPVTEPWVLADADTPAAFEQLRVHERTITPAQRLSGIKAVISDMDGVLWRNRTPLPGLHDFFALLDARGLRYVLVTNNASKTPQQYVHKLAQMGVTTTPDHVLNSALATAAYLAETAPAGAWVYALGGPGTINALQDHGFRLSAGDQADYVVASWDRDLTWNKLATATRLILDGAGFVGTNPDVTFPLETTLAPGAGSLLTTLEATTGITPTVIGKPYPALYRQALARMDAQPEETLVIGDRLNTDILGGVRLGLHTALLLSGVTRPEQVPHSPIHPDMTFEHLAALVAAWNGESYD